MYGKSGLSPGFNMKNIATLIILTATLILSLTASAQLVGVKKRVSNLEQEKAAFQKKIEAMEKRIQLQGHAVLMMSQSQNTLPVASSVTK